MSFNISAEFANNSSLLKLQGDLPIHKASLRVDTDMQEGKQQGFAIKEAPYGLYSALIGYLSEGTFLLCPK